MGHHARGYREVEGSARTLDHYISCLLSPLRSSLDTKSAMSFSAIRAQSRIPCFEHPRQFFLGALGTLGLPLL